MEIEVNPIQQSPRSTGSSTGAMGKKRTRNTSASSSSSLITPTNSNTNTIYDNSTNNNTDMADVPTLPPSSTIEQEHKNNAFESVSLPQDLPHPSLSLSPSSTSSQLPAQAQAQAQTQTQTQTQTQSQLQAQSQTQTDSQLPLSSPCSADAKKNASLTKKRAPAWHQEWVEHKTLSSDGVYSMKVLQWVCSSPSSPDDLPAPGNKFRLLFLFCGDSWWNGKERGGERESRIRAKLLFFLLFLHISHLWPSNKSNQSITQSIGKRKKTKQPGKVEVCPKCNKKISDVSGLRKHLRTHGERRYVCGIDGCTKRFLDKSKLKRHELVHTNERPYVCAVPNCDKRFSLEYNLKTHMRVHTGERPFRCMVAGCKKAFTQDSNLRAHAKLHHSS